MLPTSPVVLLTGVALGVIALLCFVWAWRRGQFDDLEAQAHLVFEPRDLRLARPWETAAQRADRLRFGEPLEPEPGEWGGAE
ncbi:MAG TPA: cbb3-type cytochrome oxidase assembly protein CcoS [Longimicrobiales bacterium]